MATKNNDRNFAVNKMKMLYWISSGNSRAYDSDADTRGQHALAPSFGVMSSTFTIVVSYRSRLARPFIGKQPKGPTKQRWFFSLKSRSTPSDWLKRRTCPRRPEVRSKADHREYKNVLNLVFWMIRIEINNVVWLNSTKLLIANRILSLLSPQQPH